MKKNYLHGILVALLICCSLVSISCANGLNSKPNDYLNHEYRTAYAPISSNGANVTPTTQVLFAGWTALADAWVDSSCSKIERITLSNGMKCHYLLIDKRENIGKAVHTFLNNAGYKYGLPDASGIQNMVPNIEKAAIVNPSLDIEAKKIMNDYKYSVVFVSAPGDYDPSTLHINTISGVIVNIKD